MGAAFYDALLLLAVWFFATAAILPFNGGQAFRTDQYLFPLYLLVVSFVFYGWFWTHGGQTLGLKAWRLKLCGMDQQTVSWPQAARRFAGAIVSWACLGLGFFWCLFVKNRLCWHDVWSNTCLVLLPPEKNGREK